MQTNRHQWKQNPLENPCDGEDDNLAWAQDNTIAGGINVFHEYSMEWTPYHIIISVDGVAKRTFTRFSSITQEPIQGSDQGTTTVIHPLKCEEIPTGQTDTLWQHILWGDLSKDNLNLIMNVGIKDVENYSKFGGEMLVDWVKVEQRIPATTVTRLNSPPGLLCVGQTAQFRGCLNFGFRVKNCQFSDETRRKIGSIVALRDQFFNEVSSEKGWFFAVSQNLNNLLKRPWLAARPIQFRSGRPPQTSKS